MPRPPLALRSTVGAIALAVAMLTTGCGSDPAPQGAAAPADEAWPHDFEAALVGGGTIDAGDYEGQDLVLWFWAPW